MPRGGPRNGKPGASYNNRSDLNVKPVRTAPISTPDPTTMSDPGGGAPSVAGGQSPSQVALPPHPNPPGSRGPLHAPTNRPAEPLTAGAPFGPGPGPEVLNQSPVPDSSVSQTLSLLAAKSGNSTLATLASQAKDLGQ